MKKSLKIKDFFGEGELDALSYWNACPPFASCRPNTLRFRYPWLSDYGNSIKSIDVFKVTHYICVS